MSKFKNRRSAPTVQRLEDRTVPAILLNEMYVNPPGTDDNREYVEIINTAGGALPLDGLTLIEIDGNGINSGRINQDTHLGGQSTGSNGLLMLGVNYATLGGTPWGTVVDDDTELGDLDDFMGNDNLTILLVQGYTGISGMDLDKNNDGTLDFVPWAKVIDGVGWLDSTVPDGRVYTSAVLTQAALTPDAASRFAGHVTPQTAAAWYNGDMLAQGGAPDMTVLYNPTASSANLPTNGRITPGDDNLVQVTTAPQVVSTIVNNGGNQRSKVTSLQVNLSAEVAFSGSPASAFVLTRDGGGTVSFSATVGLQGGKTVVVLSDFSGVETQFGSLRDGRFTLTALANQISNTGGQLNGGANYTFGDAQGLFRMFGDFNGDRQVDGFDFGAFSSTFNLTAAHPSFLAMFDINGDGIVDGFDFSQFSGRFGTLLP
jgi:hypothetical protein